MAEAQEVPPKEPKILPKEVKQHVLRLTPKFLEALAENPYFLGASSNPFRVRGRLGQPDSASFEQVGEALFRIPDWGGTGESRECHLRYDPERGDLFFQAAESLPRGPGGSATPDEQWVSLFRGGDEMPPRLNYFGPAFPSDHPNTRSALEKTEGVLSELQAATVTAVARQSAA